MPTITLTDDEAVQLDRILEDVWPSMRDEPEPGTEDALAVALRRQLGFPAWRDAEAPRLHRRQSEAHENG